MILTYNTPLKYRNINCVKPKLLFTIFNFNVDFRNYGYLFKFKGVKMIGGNCCLLIMTDAKYFRVVEMTHRNKCDPEIISIWKISFFFFFFFFFFLFSFMT